MALKPLSPPIGGIDVSQWQGSINWTLTKTAIGFALIRAGYGDSLTYPNQVDTQFKRNFSECKRLGIPVGIYYYCYAETPEQAKREAQCCIALLKTLGMPFEFPVYYDVEEMDTFLSGKTNEIIEAFATELEKAGYWVGIYTYRSAAQTYLNQRTRSRYAMAVAEYASALHYADQYGIWQNSSTWTVSGISGSVDHDYCYYDYPSEIKARGKNGFPAPAPQLTYQVLKDTPIVSLKGTVPKGKTVKIGGRKTVCGVQYGRIDGTPDDWISLKDCKQIS